MAKKIEVIGDIIDDHLEWVYNWIEEPYTSPHTIKKNLPTNSEEVEIYINSGGGSVYAGFEIYNLLSEYTGNVTIKIVGICASAASFISQAKNAKVLMSPMSQMMIHRASTNISGNKNILDDTSNVLNITDETIAQAYADKSGQTVEKILNLMDKETFLSPSRALELGLVDEIMFSNKDYNEAPTLYNSLTHGSNLINKLKDIKESHNDKGDERMTIDDLKNKYPELTQQLKENEKQNIENEIIKKERERVQAINKLVGMGNQKLLDEGIEQGLTAEQVAYNILMEQKSTNQNQLVNMQLDARDSGVEDVPSLQNQQNAQYNQQELIDMLIQAGKEIDKERGL